MALYIEPAYEVEWEIKDAQGNIVAGPKPSRSAAKREAHMMAEPGEELNVFTDDGEFSHIEEARGEKREPAEPEEGSVLGNIQDEFSSL